MGGDPATARGMTDWGFFWTPHPVPGLDPVVPGLDPVVPGLDPVVPRLDPGRPLVILPDPHSSTRA
ncbi:MAG: hypothetical protein LBR21_04620, partial [Propionibacteriaceae bacterium]|nr:hypothetical protein [Propionibacteriaceae bacterium]